jgi:hypothetical protein
MTVANVRVRSNPEEFELSIRLPLFTQYGRQAVLPCRRQTEWTSLQRAGKPSRSLLSQPAQLAVGSRCIVNSSARQEADADAYHRRVSARRMIVENLTRLGTCCVRGQRESLYESFRRSRSSSIRSETSRGRCCAGASGSAAISSTYVLCKDTGLE